MGRKSLSPCLKRKGHSTCCGPQVVIGQDIGAESDVSQKKLYKVQITLFQKYI